MLNYAWWSNINGEMLYKQDWALFFMCVATFNRNVYFEQPSGTTNYGTDTFFLRNDFVGNRLPQQRQLLVSKIDRGHANIIEEINKKKRLKEKELKGSKTGKRLGRD